ncbi:MAG TPA: ferrochelatase [Gemmatimonadales bacterium]|nr:ferrochelatase [Gemmatimonadales bacterium]
MSAPIGVLVMAYGGPNSLAEVEPYLLDVRGHRPTPAHVVDEVKSRYAAIGGRSPILEKTTAQARALEAALGGNGHFKAVVGMRHWQPRIAAGLASLADAGVEHVVGLVMAPHYSALSIEVYLKQVEASRGSLAIAPVREWHLLPGFLVALEDRITEALDRFPEAQRDTVPLLFTAHSLPQRILESGDPYPAQLAATVAAVLLRLDTQGQGRVHRFAYQSAGRTADPWLGPDAGTVIEELAALGHRTVLVVPIGFTCEHVEVLYDVDLELRRRATGLGVHLERIVMVNDHPAMIDGLADLVRRTAAGQGWM